MSDDTMLNEDDIKKMIDGLAKGLTIADVTNTDKDTLENLYALAYKYYTVQDFKNALTVFQVLCTYNINEEKYWMGLAGCRQGLEQYKEAIDAYSMAGLASSLKNPIPFFYATQCFLKMGDKESAIGSLQSLLTMGDENNEEHNICKAKAAELLKLLQESKTESQA